MLMEKLALLVDKRKKVHLDGIYRGGVLSDADISSLVNLQSSVELNHFENIRNYPQSVNYELIIAEIKFKTHKLLKLTVI